MKKLLIVLISCLMMMSVSGCKSKKALEENKGSETIEADENLLTVDLTFPASFLESMETSGEEFVSGLEEDGTDLKAYNLNNDGSVTVTMTKKQHRELMKEMSEGFEQSLQELVDDEQCTITTIEHNSKFTEFTVTLEGDELNTYDSFSSLIILMTSGMYQAFDTTDVKHVHITYVNAAGSVIDEFDSDNLQSESGN